MSKTIKAAVFPSWFDSRRCDPFLYDLTQALAFFGYEMVWLGHPETFIILKKQDLECSTLTTIDLHIQEADMCHLIGRHGCNIESLKRRLNKQISAKPLIPDSFASRGAVYKTLIKQMPWEALPIDTLIDVVRLKNVVHNILYTKPIPKTGNIGTFDDIRKNITDRPEVYYDHAGYSDDVKTLCEQIKENLEPCLVNELCMHLSEMQNSGLLYKGFDYKTLLLTKTFEKNYVDVEKYPFCRITKKDGAGAVIEDTLIVG